MTIPSWMVNPQAANHSLSEYAAICSPALLSLSDLIETFKESKDVEM